MMRTAGTITAVLAAAFVAACTETEPPSDTQSTTRALLSQDDFLGGPSTPIEGVPDLVSRAGRVYIPELGHNFGAREAPLKLIEYSDFGCGYCRRFHEESFAALHEQFVETGRIEWKFMPFITGSFQNSLAVTEAAECTLEQDASMYEAYSDGLWARQAEWKGSSEPEALARGWARELGADMDRFDSCLAEDRRIERIAGATVVAQELGIRGTPTFWLVGYGPLQGALPLDVFQGVLGAVLEQIEAQGGGSAPTDSVGAD